MQVFYTVHVEEQTKYVTGAGSASCTIPQDIEWLISGGEGVTRTNDK